MKYFGRIDEMVEVIASLGVQKSVQDVNRKIVMTLTSDYEMEERTTFNRWASPERRLRLWKNRGTCAFPLRWEKTWVKLHI